MKAAWRDVYGPPSVVTVRDIPRPEPDSGEVLVRVRAASINRADLDGLYPRWAFIRLFLGLRAPKQRFRRLGADLAGTVEAVGDNVKDFKPGDEVFSDFSVVGAGSFAEYVCGPEKAFSQTPAGLSFEEAACLAHSGVLAVRGFDARGGREVGEGSRVLVVGASGNVGPYCIQIAKSLGAHITGVASAEKLDFVRSLGADEVMDYRTTDYTRPAEAYDRIIDVDAHYSLLRWRGALTPGGVYLAFGGPASWLLSSALMGPFLSRATGKSIRMAFVPPFQPDPVAKLKRLAEDGVLTPVIDRRFTLDDVVAALRYVDDGHARGKVVISIAS
jgi:NADPH:quinone reductase-like Zn-dependent oxidoreductase